MVNEKALIDVRLNSQEAEHQLQELQGEMKRLIELKRKAEEAGDVAGYKKIDSELKKVSRSANKLINDHRSLEQTLKNLNGASLKELRDAQRALTSQTEKLNRESKEYFEKSKQLKLVNAEISKVNAQYRSQGSLIGRVAEGFNRYFSMVTAALASFTGVALTIKSATEAYAKHDDTMSDVMKTTRMAKEEVKDLNKEFTKIDTRTTRENLNVIAEEGGRIGIAKEDILEFVKAMDIANVALGDSFTGGTEEIAGTLGKLKFLFSETKNMGVEKAYLSIASAINELGADGVASEQNIAEFTTRLGALSDVLKPSIADALALGAGFEESGIQAEIASRAYSIVLNRAATETSKFAQVMGMSTKQVEDLINTNPVDFFFAFAESLKGMNATETARTLDELKINADGANKVIGAAANNTDRFRQLLDLSNKSFHEANSVIEEFNTKNTNAQANLEKARKTFSDTQLELGERLAPAYASVIHKGSLMLKTTGAIVEFFFKHGKVLALATTAIVTYTIAINAHNIATRLYNSLTTAATLITKGFNTAVKTNPIGLLISLLTTVATGFILFSKKAGDAKKAQSDFNEVVRQGNDLLGQKKTLEERAVVMKNLSKDQLSSLKTDLEYQVKAEEDYHAVLLQKAKKRLDEDAELKRISEAKNQANISQIQKINLDAQFSARSKYLVKELEEENKANQQRLKNLRKTLAEVSNEFKNRPANKPEDDGIGTETGNINNTAQNAFELAYKQQLLALKTYYANKQHLQEEAHARELALELAHLQALAELETDEGKRLDLKIRIIDAQVKYNEALTKAIPEMIKNEQQGDKLGTRLLETAKLTDYASQKQYEAATATEVYTAKQQQQAQTIQMIGGVMTDYITSALNGQADSFESFGQTLILMSLQILKQMVPIWSAQILGFSLSSPESVASWGVAGMAKYTAITALMYAGIAAAEGAVNRNIEKKRKASGSSNGFYSGGWTGYGPETEVAGLVHRKEYVINAETVRNPMALPHIQKIDAIQQGNTTNSDSGTNSNSTGHSPIIDLRILSDLATEIRELRKWRPPVDLQTFESKWDQYNDIKQKRNL